MVRLFLPNVAPQPLMRSVISPYRRLALTCALVLGLAHTSQAQTKPEIELSLEQAHALAVHAVKTGDPGAAIQISKRILRAHPKDATAYYVIAVAHSKLNQPHDGRVAAAKSYRLVDPGPERFRTAQLAARLAYEEGRPSLAQIWLRRTAIHATTEDDIERVGQDYKILRQVNPWTFRLNGGLRPSNNVNNGSDTALNIIDGVPDNGDIPASARALSGVIGTIDISAGYRLYGSKTRATTIGGRLYVQRVELSSYSKTKAPKAKASDFSSTYAEASLKHVFAVGPADKGGSMILDFALGESWAGGERYYRFGRLNAKRIWHLDKTTRVSLRASGEHRSKVRYEFHDGRVLGLGAEYTKVFKNGSVMNLYLAQQDTKAKELKGTFTSTSLRTSYTFAKPVGPAKLTLGLVLGYTHYDAYDLSWFHDPTARSDKSAYADMTWSFYKYDYAGFIPTLRLRAGKRRSNFSRYDSRELSVSVGIASKF